MSGMSTKEDKLSRVEQKQLSEQRLIIAAMEIAATEGVAAVTFDSIGKHSGYSRGLASQKFGSKDGLLRAVTDFLFDERSKRPSLVALENLDGLSALVRYVKLHFQEIHGWQFARAYYMFFASAIADDADSKDVFRYYHSRFREYFTSMIERGQADGSIRSFRNVEISGEMFGSILLGTALQAMTNPEMDLKAAEKEIIAYVKARYGAS